MKSLKNILSTLAFILAIGAVSAYDTSGNEGGYVNIQQSASCLTAITDQWDCDRYYCGAQCTVTVGFSTYLARDKHVCIIPSYRHC